MSGLAFTHAEMVSIIGAEPDQWAAKLHDAAPAYLVVEAKALQWLFPDFVAEPQRYGLRLEKIFTGNRRNHLLL